MVALSSVENIELRSTLRGLFITQKDLAEACGVHELTLFYWLKRPLTPEREARINDGINKILKLREGGAINATNE